MTLIDDASPVALITGASRGLGRALAQELSEQGWRLVLDARHGRELDRVASRLPGAIAIAGDVSDATHRTALLAAVLAHGGLDLLVNNASDLGPSPLPALAGYPLDDLRRVFETNVLAPLALTQLLMAALLARRGTVVMVSSDAAREPYEGWGGYGSSKAALEQVAAVLGVEAPQLLVYALDPGDMRTQMHQDAFPGQDISDRALPQTVVPAFLRLLEARPASGRYRAADLLSAAATL